MLNVLVNLNRIHLSDDKVKFVRDLQISPHNNWVSARAKLKAADNID